MNVGDKATLKHLGPVLDGMKVEVSSVVENTDTETYYSVQLLETRQAYVEGEYLDVSRYNLEPCGSPD